MSDLCKHIWADIGQTGAPLYVCRICGVDAPEVTPDARPLAERLAVAALIGKARTAALRQESPTVRQWLTDLLDHAYMLGVADSGAVALAPHKPDMGPFAAEALTVFPKATFLLEARDLINTRLAVLRDDGTLRHDQWVYAHTIVCDALGWAETAAWKRMEETT